MDSASIQSFSFVKYDLVELRRYDMGNYSHLSSPVSGLLVKVVISGKYKNLNKITKI